MSARRQSDQCPADRYLTSRQVAALLNVSLACLSRWRSTGKGPPWRAMSQNQCPRYLESEVRRFMDAATVSSTLEAKALKATIP